MKIILLAYTVAVLLLPLDASAYLDPATGGMFFSATFGVITTLFFVAKSLYYKVHGLWAHLRGRQATDAQALGVVFYSEGPQYWETFQPIVRELTDRGIPCHYLSSSENDPGLRCNLALVQGKFIGSGAKSFFYMNTLRADLVIMTTPGLDVLQLKRSKGVKHYMHVTHSAGGCGGISAFGLDYYDSVMLGGFADQQMVLELEELRGIKKKELEIIGCTYLDIKRERLAQEKFSRHFNNDRPSILISPTWGAHGLLAVHGEKLISNILSSSKFNIIIRPHPQSMIEEKLLIESLQKRFPESPHLHWDTSVDNLPVLSEASLMISDWSGILFDYTFLFERPVFVFKGQYKKSGKEAMFLKQDPWALRATDRFALCLKAEDVGNISSLLDNALANAASLKAAIAEARQGLDAYPNQAGKRSAEFITKILTEIRA